MSHKSNILLLILCVCCWQYLPAQQAAVMRHTAASQETMLPNVSEVFLQKLIDTAIQNYPRMQVYNKRVLNAGIELNRTKLGWFDAFSFSWLYSPNNSTTLVNPNLLNGYQVGMFVNFGALAQRPSQIKKAKTDLEITKAEIEEYKINITTLVKQRYYLYIQALSVLKLKAQALMDVESTVQQAKYKFEKGEETLESYTKDLVSYEDRIQGKMDAETAVLIARSNLEELLGTKLENIK